MEWERPKALSCHHPHQLTSGDEIKCRKLWKSGTLLSRFTATALWRRAMKESDDSVHVLRTGMRDDKGGDEGYHADALGSQLSSSPVVKL